MKFVLAFIVLVVAVGVYQEDDPRTNNPSHPLNDLYCDFIFKDEPVVIEHPLKNGKWRVTLVMGDEKLNHANMQVMAEGKSVGPPCNSMIGQFVYASRFGSTATPAYFDVEVSDGSLTLKFSPSEEEGYHEWVLNQMKIERLSDFEDDEKSPTKEFRYDFGTEESPVQPGYTQISNSELEPMTSSIPIWSKNRKVITGIFADLFLELEFPHSGPRYGDRVFRYRLYEPPQREIGKRYPLVVWLHGYDEAGEDNHAHLRWLRDWFFDPVFLRNNQFYLLAVQCPSDDKDWTHSKSNQPEDMGDICKLIAEKTIRDYPIDQERVCLSGMSSGGTSSWNIGGRYPDMFAAIVPLSSKGGDPDLVPKLKSVPVWAFNNQEDSLAPHALEKARQSVELLNAEGGNAHLTALDGKYHITRPYLTPELKVAEWMLSRRRSDPGWWSRPGMPPSKHPPSKTESKTKWPWFGILPIVVAGAVLVWWRRASRSKLD